MIWKLLASATLIVSAMFIGHDMLQLGAFNLSEVPLGAYPIPFSTGVKEALSEFPEDTNRKFTAKLARAKAWLDTILSSHKSQPVIAGVT